MKENLLCANAQLCFPIHNFFGILKAKKSAFSLVEMLMALLVASLLLAALAPVMTKKMNENIHITSEFTQNGKSETIEISYGHSKYCPNIVKDNNGNELYCEGEYVVSDEYQNITVTAIGAGGGGGTAPTAGYIEYTQAGSINTFTVPVMVDQLEATLISGGAGGGAGGQAEKTQTFSTPSVSSWDNIPAVIKGKYVNVIGCGGGGGGGGSHNIASNKTIYGGGGGSGGYRTTPMAVKIGQNATSISYQVGGGGGGGGDGSSAYVGKAGACGGGGDGGSDFRVRANNTCNPVYGGLGGGGDDCSSDILVATGGKPNGGSSPYIVSVGPTAAQAGGVGANGGNGGKSGYEYKKEDGCAIYLMGGGGGGAYGGGGGGGGCTGGGGGGGGPTYFNEILIASGGGGGGSTGGSNSGASWTCIGGGGGGGGGNGGGNGGNGGDNAAQWSGIFNPGGGGKGGYPSGSDGSTTTYGYNTALATAAKWGTDYCRGGIGGGLSGNQSGESGKSGIIKVTYLDYGPGGGGGGGAQMVPIQAVNVTPNEDLSIKVGKGASGGQAGAIGSDGTITSATIGHGNNTSEQYNIISELYRQDGSVILSTVPGNKVAGNGTRGGTTTGETFSISIAPHTGSRGYITDGVHYNSGNPEYNQYSYGGAFQTGDGHNAEDPEGTKSPFYGNKTYPNGSTGGAGGTATTPWFTCTAGKGGTSSNPKGGDASGYGCGGGGGYGLSDGGKGSGGYARLSWNMYWDSAANAYKTAEIGAGGGGASGNTITETVRVNKGQVIKIRIGAGGIGAKVSNNTIIPATDGGTTVFGDANFIEIKAGGGGGGGISADDIKSGNINALTNKKGGKISTICQVGSSNYINNKNRCTKGLVGNASGDNGTNPLAGGAGADYTLTLNNKTYRGSGGIGGNQTTEMNNSRGQTPENGHIASGGGGSALLIYNKITNLSELNNPQGGNGAPGKIILRLWE